MYSNNSILEVGELTLDVGETTPYVGELTRCRWRNDRLQMSSSFDSSRQDLCSNKTPGSACHTQQGITNTVYNTVLQAFVRGFVAKIVIEIT